VALADKLRSLVGMFGIGQIPTGDKDRSHCAGTRYGINPDIDQKELPLPQIPATNFGILDTGSIIHRNLINSSTNVSGIV
jgi:hypothetical protein